MSNKPLPPIPRSNSREDESPSGGRNFSYPKQQQREEISLSSPSMEGMRERSRQAGSPSGAQLGKSKTESNLLSLDRSESRMTLGGLFSRRKREVTDVPGTSASKDRKASGLFSKVRDAVTDHLPGAGRREGPSTKGNVQENVAYSPKLGNIVEAGSQQSEEEEAPNSRKYRSRFPFSRSEANLTTTTRKLKVSGPLSTDDLQARMEFAMPGLKDASPEVRKQAEEVLEAMKSPNQNYKSDMERKDGGEPTDFVAAGATMPFSHRLNPLGQHGNVMEFAEPPVKSDARSDAESASQPQHDSTKPQPLSQSIHSELDQVDNTKQSRDESLDNAGDTGSIGTSTLNQSLDEPPDAQSTPRIRYERSSRRQGLILGTSPLVQVRNSNSEGGPLYRFDPGRATFADGTPYRFVETFHTVGYTLPIEDSSYSSSDTTKADIDEQIENGEAGVGAQDCTDDDDGDSAMRMSTHSHEIRDATAVPIIPVRIVVDGPGANQSSTVWRRPAAIADTSSATQQVSVHMEAPISAHRVTIGRPPRLARSEPNLRDRIERAGGNPESPVPPIPAINSRYYAMNPIPNSSVHRQGPSAPPRRRLRTFFSRYFS